MAAAISGRTIQFFAAIVVPFAALATDEGLGLVVLSEGLHPEAYRPKLTWGTYCRSGGLYRGLYGGVLQGLLRRILGV